HFGMTHLPELLVSPRQGQPRRQVSPSATLPRLEPTSTRQHKLFESPYILPRSTWPRSSRAASNSEPSEPSNACSRYPPNGPTQKWVGGGRTVHRHGYPFTGDLGESNGVPGDTLAPKWLTARA